MEHGGGKRCQVDACTKGREGDTPFCDAHGGGRKRCHSDVCREGAKYKKGETYFCHRCFVPLIEGKPEKVRRVSLFLVELERVLPRLSVFETVWDRRAPGVRSIKHPEKLYVMPDRYIHIEFGEFERIGTICVDNNKRLKAIAKKIGLPGYVIYVNIDIRWHTREPLTRNGEVEIHVVDFPYRRLMRKTAQVIEEIMRGPAPDSVECVFVAV